jgi:hypothetical protein
MVFNTSKDVISRFYFFLKGELIGITMIYTWEYSGTFKFQLEVSIVVVTL